jgi:hypothetical protein
MIQLMRWSVAEMQYLHIEEKERTRQLAMKVPPQWPAPQRNERGYSTALLSDCQKMGQ